MEKTLTKPDITTFFNTNNQISIPDTNAVIRKVVLSGEYLEVLNFKRAIKPPKQKKKKGVKRSSSSKLSSIIYNQMRARKQVKRLVLCNFEYHQCTMLTLTYAENMQDVAKAKKDFNLFMKRLRYHLGIDFLPYIYVIEFQDRGACHFHAILGSPFIDFNLLTSVWGFGHIWIAKINNNIHLANYICKYLSKDFIDVRLAGFRAWQSSRGLRKPIVLRDRFSSVYNKLSSDGATNFLNSIKEKELLHSETFDIFNNNKVEFNKYLIKSIFYERASLISELS